MLPAPIIAATLAFITVCMAGDLRSRRIPNLLCGLGILAGIALNAVSFGIDGVIASLAGFLVMVALLLAPFAMGGLGGGDVKMMGAIGALLGVRITLGSLLLGMALGGVVMAIHLARLGRLRQTLATIGTMASAAILGRTLEPLRVSATQPGAITLPYSLPLGLGTIAVLAYSSIVL